MIGWILRIGSFALGNWSRIAIYGALALAAIAVVWGHGYHKGVQKLWDYQVEQAQQTVKLIVKQGAVTERVVTKYIKVKAETIVVERTIEKEVIRYAQDHPGLCLDHQWGRLHDAAALGAVPQPATPADGASGAPEAATALQTVTENYAACLRTAARLDALQEWVEAQKELNPPEAHRTGAPRTALAPADPDPPETTSPEPDAPQAAHTNPQASGLLPTM
jgi:hypothetical protein